MYNKKSTLPVIFSLYSIIAAFIFFGVSPAVAQEESSEAECEITLREIVADNSGAGIDSKLKDIKKDLEKLAYSTYRLEKTFHLILRKAQTKTLDLLGETRLALTPEGYEEGKIRLKIKLSPSSSRDRALETLLRIPDGGTFIIGGPAYRDGVLILAFTARK